MSIPAVYLTPDEGIAEIIFVAEGLGWIDTFGDADGLWTAEEADACEESALDYLADLGIAVVQAGDEELQLLNNPGGYSDYWIARGPK